MVEFRQFIIWGLLMSLFLVALLSFGIQLHQDNNSDSLFLSSDELGGVNTTKNNLITQLNSAQTTAENQSQVQEQTNPTSSAGDLIIDSTPHTAQATKNSVKNSFGIMFSMLTGVLRVNPIIISVLSAILLVTIIALIWAFIKTGR